MSHRFAIKQRERRHVVAFKAAVNSDDPRELQRFARRTARRLCAAEREVDELRYVIERALATLRKEGHVADINQEAADILSKWRQC